MTEERKHTEDGVDSESHGGARMPQEKRESSRCPTRRWRSEWTGVGIVALLAMPGSVRSWPDDILGVLCCPITRQRLRVLDRDEAANLGLGAREALLREDGKVGYALDEHGFPDLLPDHALPVPPHRLTGDDSIP